MTIAEVLAWKFNNQPGMRCETVDGVLKITEFPNGVPSQAEQDTWTAEYDAFVAGGGMADKIAGEQMDREKVSRLFFEVCFDLESRVRVLEVRPAITKVQYRNALLTRLKGLP